MAHHSHLEARHELDKLLRGKGDKEEQGALPLPGVVRSAEKGSRVPGSSERLMAGKTETAEILDCSGEELLGILHAAERRVGVIIVVGGPQYRVGSHRQFVLMARRIAAAGYPVLRFDYRGMGDSGGGSRTFEAIGEDIASAINHFKARLPRLEAGVLLGLCDAASAIMMYCDRDPWVAGLVLLNPWARTTQGEARSYLRHYYLQRLLTRAFWGKVLSGKFQMRNSLRDVATKLLSARRSTEGRTGSETREAPTFVDRMQAGLQNFDGEVLFLISGRDLTAQEFMDLNGKSKAWKRATGGPKVLLRTLLEADHTFSRRAHLDAALDECIAWLEQAVPRPEHTL